MSASVIALRQARKPFPIPESAGIVLPVLGLGFDAPWTRVGFTLSRCKEGTEIGLQHGKFWWNLSHLLNVYPPSFKEARKWIAVYAAQHGQTVTEMRRQGPRWVFPCPTPSPLP
jgi:hypothetical protein